MDWRNSDKLQLWLNVEASFLLGMGSNIIPYVIVQELAKKNKGNLDIAIMYVLKGPNLSDSVPLPLFCFIFPLFIFIKDRRIEMEGKGKETSEGKRYCIPKVWERNVNKEYLKGEHSNLNPKQKSKDLPIPMPNTFTFAIRTDANVYTI